MNGTIYRRKKGGRELPTYWLQYSVNGKQVRESSGTADRDEALRILSARVALARDNGVGPTPRGFTLADLVELLARDQQLKGNRTSANSARVAAKVLERMGNRPVRDIDSDLIEKYTVSRLRDAKPATVAYELALLRRAFRLAVLKHKIATHAVPHFQMPRVDNARVGFFEESEVRAILAETPSWARTYVEFLYLTGWRKSEVSTLRWADVDWQRETVTLRTSKNGEGRVFPFGTYPRLRDVLKRQLEYTRAIEHRRRRIVPFVFHYKARPLRMESSWRQACIRAGLPGKLLHDFRRTAVRNLVQAGVPMALAKKLTGHKTDSVFQRYLIVDTGMLEGAVEKLANKVGGAS